MTQLFDEVRFPTNIAFTSQGGPQRQSQVVYLGSGTRATNARWAGSIGSWDAVYGKKTLNELDVVGTFFEARNARLIGFRFKWAQDFRSCPPTNIPTPTDQQFGTGDGATTVFQLTKKYTSGPSTYTKTIFKPVAGTVQIANNSSLVAPSGYTLDTTTGLVTFGAAPAAGHKLTWGGEFDRPVQFGMDKLVIEITDPGYGIIQSLNLLEMPVL